TTFSRDWSSDVCSSDLPHKKEPHWASHSKSWRPAYRVEIQISNAVLVRRTRLRSGTRESTCGAGFTPADGAAFPVRRGFPPLSAGINPAPQKEPHWASHSGLGGPLAAWRSRSATAPLTAGRRPGRAPGEPNCGAGFTPADGAAFPLRRVFPRLSAGINPAPQKRTALGLALQELAARLSRGNPDQQPRLEQRERHQAGHGEAQAAVLALEPGDA